MKSGIVSSKRAIPNDPSLLRMMIADATKHPNCYQPGDYWRHKAKNATREIEKFGLSDFRGASSCIGISFTDCIYEDIRQTMNSSLMRRLIRMLFNTMPPFKQVLRAQIALTKSYINETYKLRRDIVGNAPAVAQLLMKYRMPESTC